MKLYMHPASTTSRAVALFIADGKLPVDLQVVDIFQGEHMKPPFASINPNKMVPVLEDGDFRMTESSAILKYLAEKSGSPAYPRDLKQRARINEVMDWINSNLYRDWGYGLIYPQVFPSHKRPSEETQKNTIAWGKERAEAWLKILNDNIIGPRNKFLCGDEISVADYFGAAIIQVGDLIRCNLSKYPNITRWLNNMKSRPGWAKTYEVINGFAESLKGQQFVAV
ncbi:MAG TPA: glutathione S-transferase family protein [Stellaceae bacterium]|nr:glutathione S-transferase family protein [Stellaceae bacterium]